MEICVVSKQYIKPSSPTPPHLETLSLSLLDQAAYVPFSPVVLFYFEHPSVDSLKRSLSETLTLFYPLAGVVKDELTVECNDQGAYFVEAEVKGHVKDFLAGPDNDLIEQLFPPITDMLNPSKPAQVTNIQISLFECGGIAIACCMNHRYIDCQGLVTFLKAWADTAFNGGGGSRVSPSYIASTLFPASSEPTNADRIVPAIQAPFAVSGRFLTKRFLFNSDSLKELQDEVSRETDQDRAPTRFEAVSACLWRSFINASRVINLGRDDPKPTILLLPVDLRRRASTLTVDEQSMGNFIVTVGAKQTQSELRLSLLKQKIREAVRKLDSELVAKLTYKGSDTSKSLLGELSEEAADCGDLLNLTSWCRFGFYGVNFGKGKPVWAAPLIAVKSLSKLSHLFILIDAADGVGIEAWFVSNEPYMDSFVRDLELHKVALVDPSPLKSAN